MHRALLHVDGINLLYVIAPIVADGERQPVSVQVTHAPPWGDSLHAGGSTVHLRAEYLARLPPELIDHRRYPRLRVHADARIYPRLHHRSVIGIEHGSDAELVAIITGKDSVLAPIVFQRQTVTRTVDGQVGILFLHTVIDGRYLRSLHLHNKVSHAACEGTA